MYRVTPLKALVTGGTVTPKTSENVPARKDFVHPMYGESLMRGSVTAESRRNARMAVKNAKQTVKNDRRKRSNAS